MICLLIQIKKIILVCSNVINGFGLDPYYKWEGLMRLGVDPFYFSPLGAGRDYNP